LLLCWQKNKLSALVRYPQSSRAERQLRKISLHLFIKFFIGHLQTGWTLENPAQQASPVRWWQCKVTVHFRKKQCRNPSVFRTLAM